MILVFSSSAVLLILIATLYRMDYLNPAIAYTLPWLMLLVFSVIPISSHARPMETATYGVIFMTLSGWLLGSTVAYDPHRKSQLTKSTYTLRENHRTLFFGAVVALYGFAALNVALAGFVPLLELFTTGQSRYDEFGIPSLYGAFLAYSDALGCMAFYLYLRSQKRSCLFVFLSILVMHIALLTRQNILTLLIQAFVIRCFVRRRFSPSVLFGSIALALVGFSILGALRSGDIKQIISVQEEYAWIPSSIIWVYSYSYFNALNIDNMISTSGAPFFDGYMWQTLLPSVFRSTIDHGTYLEIESMTVSSYILPVYIDIGRWVALWTLLLSTVTSYFYRRALKRREFIDIAIYSCLYFCALMSFFTDFWLYLPVIFQVIFFAAFNRLFFRRTAVDMNVSLIQNSI